MTYLERKRFERRRQIAYGIMLLTTFVVVAAFWLVLASILTPQ